MSLGARVFGGIHLQEEASYVGEALSRWQLLEARRDSLIDRL